MGRVATGPKMKCLESLKCFTCQKTACGRRQGSKHAKSINQSSPAEIFIACHRQFRTVIEDHWTAMVLRSYHGGRNEFHKGKEAIGDQIISHVRELNKAKESQNSDHPWSEDWKDPQYPRDPLESNPPEKRTSIRRKILLLIQIVNDPGQRILDPQTH